MRPGEHTDKESPAGKRRGRTGASDEVAEQKTDGTPVGERRAGSDEQTCWADGCELMEGPKRRKKGGSNGPVPIVPPMAIICCIGPEVSMSACVLVDVSSERTHDVTLLEVAVHAALHGRFRVAMVGGLVVRPGGATVLFVALFGGVVLVLVGDALLRGLFVAGVRRGHRAGRSRSLPVGWMVVGVAPRRRRRARRGRKKMRFQPGPELI